MGSRGGFWPQVSSLTSHWLPVGNVLENSHLDARLLERIRERVVVHGTWVGGAARLFPLCRPTAHHNRPSPLPHEPPLHDAPCAGRRPAHTRPLPPAPPSPTVVPHCHGLAPLPWGRGGGGTARLAAPSQNGRARLGGGSCPCWEVGDAAAAGAYFERRAWVGLWVMPRSVIWGVIRAWHDAPAPSHRGRDWGVTE